MSNKQLAQSLLDKIDMFIELEYTNDEVLNEVVKELEDVNSEEEAISFTTNKINDMF